MTILVLAALKEELKPILKIHPCTFEKDIRVYHSHIYPSLYFATTGPGVSEKNKVKKILEFLIPRIIINIGLVGVLDSRESIQVGDLVKINTIVKSKNEIQFVGGPGKYTLVTVDKPYFDPIDKMDLKLNYKAHICDMEAAKIIEIVGSYEILKRESYIIFIKVAGDRPEDYFLFEYEHLVREWDKKNLKEKFQTILKFPKGILGIKKLLHIKKKSLQSLVRHTLEIIDQIYYYNNIPNKIGSIFIPHEEI